MDQDTRMIIIIACLAGLGVLLILLISCKLFYEFRKTKAVKREKIAEHRRVLSEFSENRNGSYPPPSYKSDNIAPLQDDYSKVPNSAYYPPLENQPMQGATVVSVNGAKTSQADAYPMRPTGTSNPTYDYSDAYTETGYISTIRIG